MDVITPTTTLTTTHSVVLVQLASGNLAMIDYSVSVGDVVIWGLLAILVVLQAVQFWRQGR